MSQVSPRDSVQACLLFIHTPFFQKVIICFLSSQQRGEEVLQPVMPPVEIYNYSQNFITVTKYTVWEADNFSY